MAALIDKKTHFSAIPHPVKSAWNSPGISYKTMVYFRIINTCFAIVKK